MQIRIEGRRLPGRSCAPGPGLGYDNVHVAVQRRGRPTELLDLTPGDSASAIWTLDCVPTRTVNGIDLKGPYIQGPPGGRFVYLSWGTVDTNQSFTLFRRAKLHFDAIPVDVLTAAVEAGVLVGRLELTDRKGHPLCAAVRPPLIDWLAVPG